jgi:acetate kinase
LRILVINCGSSSLKLGVFEADQRTRQLLKATFEAFSNGGCEFKMEVRGAFQTGRAPHKDITSAIEAVPAFLEEHALTRLDAVGHRVVHGGERFRQAQLLDAPAVREIESLVPLAPLHNPANLLAIRNARTVWPELPQVAVFDTSFHLTNPERATTYAVPRSWREAGLRRFGFHGTSHKYVALRAAEEIGVPFEDLQLVSLHLGNGASACAVNRGESRDSSMGVTPLEGLVMGTRSGDIDPGAFGFLERRLGLSISQIEAALYNESGLKGLTGSNDMREIEDRAAAGDREAQLAIEIYAYRARKYVGAYAAAMGGLDVVVFTGGIGENSAPMRRKICDGLEFMGLRLDDERNRKTDLADNAAPQIQAQGSRVRVIVTETAEQLMIARETLAALSVNR